MPPHKVHDATAADAAVAPTMLRPGRLRAKRLRLPPSGELALLETHLLTPSVARLSDPIPSCAGLRSLEGGKLARMYRLAAGESSFDLPKRPLAGTPSQPSAPARGSALT